MLSRTPVGAAPSILVVPVSAPVPGIDPISSEKSYPSIDPNTDRPESHDSWRSSGCPASGLFRGPNDSFLTSALPREDAAEAAAEDFPSRNPFSALIAAPIMPAASPPPYPAAVVRPGIAPTLLLLLLLLLPAPTGKLLLEPLVRPTPTGVQFPVCTSVVVAFPLLDNPLPDRGIGIDPFGELSSPKPLDPMGESSCRKLHTSRKLLSPSEEIRCRAPPPIMVLPVAPLAPAVAAVPAGFPTLALPLPLVFAPGKTPPLPAVPPPTAPFIVPVECVVGDIDNDKSVMAPLLPAAALGSIELAISAMRAYHKNNNIRHIKYRRAYL
jgi:hypothetical protein